MRISDWSSDVCSSDLSPRPDPVISLAVPSVPPIGPVGLPSVPPIVPPSPPPSPPLPPSNCAEAGVENRSEEHTSELQSLMRISYAVFCLKKKRLILENEKKHIKSIPTPQETTMYT